MAYRTIHGRDLEYVFGVVQSIYGNMQKATSKEAKAWITAYGTLFNAMTNLDNECTSLRYDNQRLKHENQFMIRMMQDNNQ